MAFISMLQDFDKHIPLVGDLTHKSPLGFQLSRGLIEGFNALQLAIVEVYINGVEIPNFVLQGIMDTCMPILIKFLPSLFVPYEWVLEETEHLAEGSHELIKIQYNLPQKMFSLMLGDGPLIYPKYTVGLWEKGALNLEQAQTQMIDDMIEKVGIKDGDRILEIGCGWGCVANYILSKFPNIEFTGLNLSGEQCKYIRRRIQDQESYLSSPRFMLYEQDFNDIEFDQKFDVIFSLGVFEHIGNLTKSFSKLASFLKDDGYVFTHIMTIRATNNISSVFTHKYIFSHGRLWNYDAIPAHNQDLKTIKRWYINGMNYSRTFASWLNNFDKYQAEISTLDYGCDYAKFRRIWRLYLLWFSRNFAIWDGTYIGNGQYLMTK